MAIDLQVSTPEEVKKELAPALDTLPEEKKQLLEKAEQNAEALMNLSDEAAPEKMATLKSLEEFGSGAMRKSAQKNALLAVTVGKLSQAGSEGGEVSKGLLDLHREIKDLDPSLIDFTKTGVLGKLFNPIRAYFKRYEKAEDVISDIIVSLNKGKTILANDNVSLELEKHQLIDLTKEISKEVELGMAMDAALSARVEKAKTDAYDPEKIKFVEEEILFPLRQKIMDMQQLIVVNKQGIVAMEIVRRNNMELIRGVDRAMTVTVAALRTAVMVASALYNQRIVLKKIQLLNETTNNLISSTSQMLKEQGAEIHTQSMQTGVSVETLKTSFANLMEALDAISTYKQQALPLMKDTIAEFRDMAEKGEVQIQRLEKGNAMR